MKPKEMWQAYLGDTAPVSLFRRYQTHDAREAARRAAADLPDLYGILRRGTWKESFQPGEQFNRETVTVVLWQHLEETREDWEPSLPELKTPSPEPATGPTPPETPEPEAAGEPAETLEAPEAAADESTAEASEAAKVPEGDEPPTDEAAPDQEA